MGELYVGLVLSLMKYQDEPGKLQIMLPELEWELDGTQSVPMLNAAFDHLQHLKDTQITESAPDDESVEYSNPALVLLEHREQCFDQLRVFSITEILSTNLNAELIGMGVGIDEGLPNPCFTVLYWADKA